MLLSKNMNITTRLDADSHRHLHMAYLLGNTVIKRSRYADNTNTAHVIGF